MKFICDNKKCAKEFDDRASRLKMYANHFCCKDCHSEFQRKYTDCPECGETFLANKRKFCSKRCANKARTGTLYKGSKTKNRAERVKRLKAELFELRGYKCECCPYSNIKIIQLHHKVERADGGTDEHDNLELLCPNCHCEHHYDNDGT